MVLIERTELKIRLALTPLIDLELRRMSGDAQEPETQLLLLVKDDPDQPDVEETEVDHERLKDLALWVRRALEVLGQPTDGGALDDVARIVLAHRHSPLVPDETIKAIADRLREAGRAT